MIKMRTSHFGFVHQIDAIAAAGYNCAELHIKEIMDLSDTDYLAVCKKIRDADITCEVFDNPLPLDSVIADESFDLDIWTEYVKKAVECTATMGARYFVFGNGRTRSIPSEGDVTGAIEKNDEMLARICSLAAEANITVLLEPLAKSICNRFLGIPEIYGYATKTGILNLKTLMDYRWFLAGGHDMQVIERYADFIQHVHIDNPVEEFPRRLVPMADDGHDYGLLFCALKKVCYKGIVSIEANTFENGFDQDIAKGIELLRYHGIESFRR